MSNRVYTLVFTFLVMVLARGVNAQTSSNPPTSFQIGGEVTQRLWVDLQKLQNFPVANENVTFVAAGQVVSGEYTGALLWDLLQAAGIKIDPTVKNDILRKIIVITGSDGYESAFGAGEIDPDFGGNQIIIAYAENGQPLGSEGFAKLIAPGDKLGGRYVSNIVTIKVYNTSPSLH